MYVERRIAFLIGLSACAWLSVLLDRFESRWARRASMPVLACGPVVVLILCVVWP